MFTIYHSNELDLLKSLTAQLMIRQPLKSLFEQEVVLVQSQGMGQWLQLQLAQEMGISANVNYPFPTQFVWNIYRIFYPNLPKNNAFSTDFMLWIIMDVLPNLAKDPRFSTLNHYFAQDDEQKYYQLANSVAGLFDQYLVYRPDWINAWQKGEWVEELGNDQEWQAALWRELVNYSHNILGISSHRAEIHQTVLTALNTQTLTDLQKRQLPKRIFIFGIISLPPLYLELFNALSLHIDVHVMFMNPCRQYWGDIVDASFVNKYIEHQNIADMLLKQSHPLLSSWGKLGRDHLSLLQNYQKQDIDIFADYQNKSLLGLVKQSILDLDNHSGLKGEHLHAMPNRDKQEIANDDNSISIHVCHSEQREVEVLYDYLLMILDKNPSIALNDCVVMVADIEHYAPYIQAVFDNAPNKRYLPYTISDQKFRNIDPIIQGFLLLLELPQSRLEIDYLFNLLEVPAIAQRFHLDEEKLKRLQTWIVEVGIRYELESKIDEPHSWLSGIQRMLLGYTMHSPMDSWQGILPYQGAIGLESELIGYLSDFVLAIAKWRGILSQPHAIGQWQNMCIELLSEFFIVNSDSEQLLLMIQDKWQSIIEPAILTEYQSDIGGVVLHSLLQSKFEQHAISHRFLIGKINFCTMMPMRSVPFKVVCLLGMNDGVYPRQINQLGFDLIAHHGRIGDRSRRNDDRYLFLEALISAQQQLYISYIGYDIQTNDVKYPSILVDELIEYLKHNYLLPGDERLDELSCETHLQRFLLHDHTRMPFNAENYINHAKVVKSYADEWLPAAQKRGVLSTFATPLPTKLINTLSIDELKRFYHHSISAFTKNRLGYFIEQVDEQLPTTEHFNLDHLERYELNNQIIAEHIPQHHIDNLDQRLYQKMLLSNQLPYGEFGKILYHQQKILMDPLIKQIKMIKQDNFRLLDIDLPINQTHVIGRIKNIQSDGVLDWRSSKLTIRDGLALWINHLLICILQPEFTHYHNRIYGREETLWCFEHLPKEQASIYLSQLIDGYLSGMNTPLFMPLKSSWCWLEKAYDDDKKAISTDSLTLDKAVNAFINAFTPSWQKNMAECDDYYLRLYPELTQQLIDMAIESAKIYLLPIIQHRDTDYAD